MKVFITGIAGFLGSHLAQYCINKGIEVAGNDTLIGGDLNNLNNMNLEFYKTDCSNLDGMTKILKNVDVVCHAAAFAHEGLSTVSPIFLDTLLLIISNTFGNFFFRRI